MIDYEFVIKPILVRESVFGLNYNNSLSLWNFDEYFLKCRVRTSAPIGGLRVPCQLIEINGQVLTRSCRPVERALVDLWHADEHGEYDNGGFRYRGHLFTDVEGRYHFRTILPALYPGRTRHYHVKVQAPEHPVQIGRAHV